jgi:DNA-binding transcriptional ArsR family regulator
VLRKCPRRIRGNEAAADVAESVFFEQDVIRNTLFPTVRAGVLSATLLQPDHWWFMTELARHLEVSPSSLQRELESLVASGFLLRRQDGRRIYFKANTESPVFPELRGLVKKTAGIVPELKAAIENFGRRIELALLYGSIARGEEHAGTSWAARIRFRSGSVSGLPAVARSQNNWLEMYTWELFCRLAGVRQLIQIRRRLVELIAFGHLHAHANRHDCI